MELTEAESAVVVARALGAGGNEKLLFSGYSVSVIQDEKVLEFCCALLCI